MIYNVLCFDNTKNICITLTHKYNDEIGCKFDKSKTVVWFMYDIWQKRVTRFSKISLYTICYSVSLFWDSSEGIFNSVLTVKNHFIKYE